MASLDDILGKKQSNDLEPVNIDGMCDCFYTFERAWIDRKAKVVRAYCKYDHESRFPIEILGEQDG